jgi:hypothetical protein
MIERMFVGAALALAVSGCARLHEYQAGCEKRTNGFVQFAECYKTEVLADRRAQGDARVKLLLLKTDQLSERVKTGSLSELDARQEFQQTFVALKDAANSEDAARQAASSTTTCVMRGKKMVCSPY